MPAYSKSPLGFPHQSPQCRFPNSRNRATSAARAHVLACPAPGQRHRKEIRANSRARPCCPWMCAESATRSGEIPIGAAGKRSVPDLWPSPCPIPIDCEISQAVPCVLWRRFLECMFPAAMAAIPHHAARLHCIVLGEWRGFNALNHHHTSLFNTQKHLRPKTLSPLYPTGHHKSPHKWKNSK